MKKCLVILILFMSTKLKAQEVTVDTPTNMEEVDDLLREIRLNKKSEVKTPKTEKLDFEELGKFTPIEDEKVKEDKNARIAKEMDDLMTAPLSDARPVAPIPISSQSFILKDEDGSTKDISKSSCFGQLGYTRYMTERETLAAYKRCENEKFRQRIYNALPYSLALLVVIGGIFYFVRKNIKAVKEDNL